MPLVRAELLVPRRRQGPAHATQRTGCVRWHSRDPGRGTHRAGQQPPAPLTLEVPDEPLPCCRRHGGAAGSRASAVQRPFSRVSRRASEQVQTGQMGRKLLLGCLPLCLVLSKQTRQRTKFDQTRCLVFRPGKGFPRPNSIGSAQRELRSRAPPQVPKHTESLTRNQSRHTSWAAQAASSDWVACFGGPAAPRHCQRPAMRPPAVAGDCSAQPRSGAR